MRQVPLPGSLVWLRQQRWRVDRVKADRRVVRLDVSHRSARLTLLAPYDRPRPVTRHIAFRHVRRRHAAVRLAWQLGSSPSARLVHALVDSNVDIWPYQVEPALAAAAGHRRILICDDVGLGKTIQAGLVLAELVRRRPGTRALVLSPASLCRQWADELRRRFGLVARATGNGFAHVSPQAQRGSNPWLQAGIWLASLDYIKQAHVLAAMPVVPWDVVIIDEAHAVAGQSERYDACDELGRRARHLVLLTATPHDGDPARFARLLRLGALPFAADSLSVFRRTRQHLAATGQRVVRWLPVAGPTEVTQLLDTLHNFERAVLADGSASARDSALLFLAVLRKRALSTVAALERSLARRLEWLESRGASDQPEWLQPGLDFGDDDLSSDDRLGLTAAVGLPRARERAWLTRLRNLAAAARRLDPKLVRLRELLRRTAEPVVIFTEFRHSLEDVQRVASTVRTTAVIHGGQPDAVFQRELQKFADGTASVLIATDVGSLGLNLQHRARWLINLELPWNPARLEQRIGRLDRLGQSKRVHASLLVSRHPAESAILSALACRTLTAQAAMGATALGSLAPPSQRDLAQSLVERSPRRTFPGGETPLSRCTSFTRAARAQAVVATRRRSLMRWWRGPCLTGRCIVSRTPATYAGQTLLVASVPLIDGTGDELERVVIPLIVPGRVASPQHVRQLIDKLTRVVEHRVHRRIARVERVMRASGARLAETERAVAAHIQLLLNPGEAQLGLFSRRAARTDEDLRKRASAAIGDAEAWLASEAGRQHIAARGLDVIWVGPGR